MFCNVDDIIYNGSVGEYILLERVSGSYLGRTEELYFLGKDLYRKEVQERGYGDHLGDEFHTHIHTDLNGKSLEEARDVWKECVMIVKVKLIFHNKKSLLIQF